MGTRADFYVKKGNKCEWLGSIAMDGYFTGKDKGQGHGSRFLGTPFTEEAFREKVTIMIKELFHGTEPAIGWPWPWPNSTMTEYAYYWTPSKRGVQPYGDIVVAKFGRRVGWIVGEGEVLMVPLKNNRLGKSYFPNMEKVQRVTYGDRSGLIVF